MSLCTTSIDSYGALVLSIGWRGIQAFGETGVYPTSVAARESGAVEPLLEGMPSADPAWQ